MAKENKAFTEMLNKFYENGLLKEVYRSEKAIVCNVFNQYYIAFSLDIVEHYTKDFPGFIMLGSSGLLEILRKDNFVNEYCGYLTQEQKTRVQMFLNDDFFAQLLEKKEEFSQCPPPSKVDLVFEREVMEKGKAAIKGMRWPKYFIRFLLKREQMQ